VPPDGGDPTAGGIEADRYPEVMEGVLPLVPTRELRGFYPFARRVFTPRGKNSAGVILN